MSGRLGMLPCPPSWLSPWVQLEELSPAAAAAALGRIAMTVSAEAACDLAAAARGEVALTADGNAPRDFVFAEGGYATNEPRDSEGYVDGLPGKSNDYYYKSMMYGIFTYYNTLIKIYI